MWVLFPSCSMVCVCVSVCIPIFWFPAHFFSSLYIYFVVRLLPWWWLPVGSSGGRIREVKGKKKGLLLSRWKFGEIAVGQSTI